MDSNDIGYTLVAIGDITYCVVFVIQNYRSCYSKAIIFFVMCVCQCGAYSKKGGKRSFEQMKVI